MFSFSFGNYPSAYMKSSVSIGGATEAGPDFETFKQLIIDAEGNSTATTYTFNTSSKAYETLRINGWSGSIQKTPTKKGSETLAEAVARESWLNCYSFSVALGESNKAQARSSLVGGALNISLPESPYSLVWGEHLTANARSQIVLGRYNKLSSDSLLIIGSGTGNNDLRNALEVGSDGRISVANILSSDGETVIPRYTPKNNYDLAPKYYVDSQQPVKSGGYYAAVMGKNTGSSSTFTGSCNYSALFGYEHSLGAQFSLVSGYKQNITGGYTLATGKGHVLSADYSSALGSYNKITHSNTSAIGTGLVSTRTSQVLIGQHNKTNSSTASKAILMVGNGASGAGSNALEVLDTGETILGADPTNDMGAATKRYVENFLKSPPIELQADENNSISYKVNGLTLAIVGIYNRNTERYHSTSLPLWIKPGYSMDTSVTVNKAETGDISYLTVPVKVDYGGNITITGDKTVYSVNNNTGSTYYLYSQNVILIPIE